MVRAPSFARYTFLVFLGLASSPARAVPEAYGVAQRPWTTQPTELKTTLWLFVPDDGSASTRTSTPPAEGEGRKGYMAIRVTVLLQDDPALRPGEEEMFVLRARFLDTGGTSSYVRVTCSPRSVWVYQDMEGPMPFERTIPVWGRDGSYDCNFTFTPRIRKKIVPPNTVTEVAVQKPSSREAVKFTWTDGGNPGQAATDYAIEVWEVRPFWWDKLIARTEVGEIQPGTAELEITREADSLINQGDYFRENYSYNVVIRLKRASAEYQASWSPPVSVSFTYRGPQAGFLERIKTKFGRELDDMSHRRVRSLDRRLTFDTLHPH